MVLLWLPRSKFHNASTSDLCNTAVLQLKLWRLIITYIQYWMYTTYKYLLFDCLSATYRCNALPYGRDRIRKLYRWLLCFFGFFLPIRGRHDKFFLERSMHWDVEIKQWGGQKEVFKWNLKRQRCTFLLMEVCFWVERVCFRSTFLSSWHSSYF